MNSTAITLAMTGASGIPYGLRLLECLLREGRQVYLLMSTPAQVVMSMETDIQVKGSAAELQRCFSARYRPAPGQLQVLGKEQWTAPIASGSSVPQAMVVCPCTSGTLAAIACGTSDNLLERAADVVLKERRQLILVPREMPLSSIHLEHMLTLSRMGAVIMPACPGFYHRPATVSELVDFVVARILDHLGVEHRLVPRWGDGKD
ncbi:MAG: flavin prenyltransferase UbiX [Gammaproteobacteria bacterium]